MPLDQQEEIKQEAEMSFLDHLEALRWHLVRSVTVILIFTTLAFIFKDIVFDKIILAPKYANFPTYRFFCYLSQLFFQNDSICIGDLKFNIINISMAGQFTTHVVVSLVAGLVISFPYVLWEVWRFIKPGLYPKERRHANGMVFFSSLLFALGISFGYYVIAPLSVNFLGNYRVSELVQNQISLSSFISTVTTTTFATGIVFQLPIVIYFLSKIGLVTPRLLKAYRKVSYVVILIISAIITPPDVSSQIIVSLPLFLLYEISIYISRAVTKENKI